MFLILGGALSFIVGLVGVLNFFNAVLTGIIARRRELAVLQAVGMTARQQRSMLVWEGLLYALGAAGLALLLAVILGPVAFRAVEGLFWFFTYHLDLTSFLLIIPLFALLGAGIPSLRSGRRRNTPWWSGSGRSDGRRQARRLFPKTAAARRKRIGAGDAETFPRPPLPCVYVCRGSRRNTRVSPPERPGAYR